MLKIFICEDNNEQRNKFTKLINDIILIENFDMEVALSATNPTEIIDYLKNNDISGLYFLDVDLKCDINGINLAEQIREYDPRGFIVFVTTHAEMSYLTFLYKVEAMDYIIKDNYDNIKERIHQCIINANKKYSSSIIHKIIIHADDRQVEFYAKMKDVECKLDERFCRCHKSYIVNKENIREIDKTKRIVYMINNEECLISTRGMKLLL